MALASAERKTAGHAGPRLSRLLIAACLLLLLGLLLSLPAARVWPLVTSSPNPPPVKLYGLQGSVWHGQADQAVVPQATLVDLEWNMRWSRLLLLQPTWRVTGHLLQADGSKSPPIELDVAPGKRITEIHNASLMLPLGEVMKNFSLPILLNGDIVAKLEEVTLEKGWPTAVQGRVALSNAKLADDTAAELGTVHIDFEEVEDGLRGIISDLDAAVKLNGEVSLQRNGSYVLTGKLTPTATTPSNLLNMLQLMGSKNRDGSISFNRRGRLRSPLNGN